MRTPARLLGLAGTIALAACPSIAAASTGWKMKHFSAGSTYTAKGTAKLCSASKFGRYSFRSSGTSHTSSGNKTVKLRGWVDILNNHTPNRIHVNQVSGSAISSYPAAYRSAIKQQIKSEINQKLRVEILAVNGDKLTMQAYYNGRTEGHSYTRTLRRMSC